MINSLVPLLVPLVLTTSPNPPTMPSYHQLRAYVTGYNTVVAQTDDTPCIAASGADICGRRDAVACPRRIGLGTVVEIRGTTYVCEDRLAGKFNGRFDISCDKDPACPFQVTGWATINVYGPMASASSSGVASRRAGIARRHATIRVASAHSAAAPARMPIAQTISPMLRHAWNTRWRALRIARG